MPARRKGSDDPVELLRTFLIVQLGLAGVGQREIRAIVGCDITRVNKVVGLLKAKPQGKNKSGRES